MKYNKNITQTIPNKKRIMTSKLIITKKILNTMLICLSFYFLAAPLHAQDINSVNTKAINASSDSNSINDTIDINEMSTLIQQQYATVKSFQADFTQVLSHLESGSQETRKGIFLFQTPFRVHWETKSPYPELFIVTDKEVWSYFPDEYLAYRYNLSIIEESYSIFSVLIGQSRLDTVFNASLVGKKNGIIQLKLIPKEPSVSMLEGFIWFEKDTGIIKEVEIIDFYYNSNKVSLDTIVWNPPITDKTFSFIPSADVEVEDHFNAGY